jgi:prolyl-tRNA editing enzyme YbaK/EbsC (Cys-tRNA(Pro) deacylase)
MSNSSIDRVSNAARAAGQKIEIRQMPQSTRTAGEAAAACGCEIGQIVKSLIFAVADTGELVLFLVSGANQVNLEKMKSTLGITLVRASPDAVRLETGFAIGGVAPIGHLKALQCWIDEDLLNYPVVWAAAGSPSAVFSIDPTALKVMTNARPIAVC